MSGNAPVRIYIPPIRTGGQARPGGTGRLDLSAAAQNPVPVVQKALQQVGRTDMPAGVKPGMSPRALEALLLSILPTERTVPPIPHPTTLPLSRAFLPGTRAGTILPHYPAEWTKELQRSIRAAAGHRCENCGMQTGDMYAHRPWSKALHAPRPLTIMVQGWHAVAHRDSDPSNLNDLRALCGACHNIADKVHTRSQKALSQAWTGQLIEHRLEHLMQETLLPAAQEAERPLGALQPGGADLITAVLADQGHSLTWHNAVDLVPALARETPEDINRVLGASIWRLKLRGLMGQDYRLTRQLTISWPDDGTYPPPSYLPPRQRRHVHSATPPRPKARPARRAPAAAEEEDPIVW